MFNLSNFVFNKKNGWLEGKIIFLIIYARFIYFLNNLVFIFLSIHLYDYCLYNNNEDIGLGTKVFVHFILTFDQIQSMLARVRVMTVIIVTNTLTRYTQITKRQE